MKKSTFYIFVLFSCLGLWALSSCGEETATTETAAAPAEMAPAAPKRSQFQLDEDGLLGISLGMALDSLVLPPETSVEETVETAEGYQWRIKTLFFANGRKAIVEGDFVTEGDPQNKLPASRVNRVIIDHPDFQTADGIRIGKSFADLIQKYGTENLEAYYIAGYDVIDVRVLDMPRLHFNLNDGTNTVAESTGSQTATVSLDLIPSESKIVSMVATF